MFRAQSLGQRSESLFYPFGTVIGDIYEKNLDFQMYYSPTFDNWNPTVITFLTVLSM